MVQQLQLGRGTENDIEETQMSRTSAKILNVN